MVRLMVYAKAFEMEDLHVYTVQYMFLGEEAHKSTQKGRGVPVEKNTIKTL
jgi:hypothetical protein